VLERQERKMVREKTIKEGTKLQRKRRATSVVAQ